jgi:hypothetical protein
VKGKTIALRSRDVTNSIVWPFIAASTWILRRVNARWNNSPSSRKFVVAMILATSALMAGVKLKIISFMAQPRGSPVSS